MAKPIIAGKNAAIPQGASFSWDVRGGYRPGQTIRGPSKPMYVQHTTLVAAGIPHSFNESGGAAEITIQGGGTIEAGQTEVPIDGWQLLNAEAQKDIFEAPNSLAIEASKTGSLGAIRNDFNAYSQGLPLPTAFTYSPAQQANVNTLSGLLLRGSTHFPVDQPILKHTQTVSDSYNGSGFNFSNQRKVYSTTQLLVECAAFPRPLPAPYIEAIQAIEAQSQSGYIWGWWKRSSELVTAANFKVEVYTEYRLDLWTTYIFSAKS